MSSPGTARKTLAQVAFDGADITPSLRKYLTSITYTDNEEDETDDLQIKMQDREDVWLTKWLKEAIEAAASKPAAAPAAASPAQSGGWAIGDKAIANGRPQYTSYGGNPGANVSNYSGSVTYLNLKSGVPYPIHVDHLGWFAESQVTKGDAKKEEAPPDPGFMIEAVFVRENWDSNGNDKLLDCGQFELDAVTAEGPPSTVTIKATSLPYGTRIRQTKKSKAWEAFTLSGIAKEIAAAGGMTLLYESDNDPFYARVEQVKTSDIKFLSKLCHDAGISLKVTNKIIVLFDQAKYEAKPSVLTIQHGRGGGYIKYRLMTGEANTKYTSCRVRYTSPTTGRKIEGIAYVEDYKADGKNNQQLEVTAKVGSAAEAETLAAKRLRLANKFGLTARFTFPGRPELVAGLTVMLTGWGIWSGKYIISQALHTVTGTGGYTTQITLRRVLEGY